jgi:signal-transduction protein with cAMP-binding, CBS, and nucleotidyltransferase domain
MNSHPSQLRSKKEVIDALTAARDSARVHLHLMSLDARERWRDLESRIDTLQSKVEREGERVGEAASKKVRELTRSVSQFLTENGGTAELWISAAQLMKPARSCQPSDTLNEAARLMWEFDCGAVPVVNHAGRLVGMITDRDICMAAYTTGQALAALSVESAMSSDVATAAPHDSVGSIASSMRLKQVRRIPVVDEGKLVGIVTLADIARHIETDAGVHTGAALDLAHTLAAISEPRASAPKAAE